MFYLLFVVVSAADARSPSRISYAGPSVHTMELTGVLFYNMLLLRFYFVYLLSVVVFLLYCMLLYF